MTRLEIATRLMAGILADPNFNAKTDAVCMTILKLADTLIREDAKMTRKELETRGIPE